MPKIIDDAETAKSQLTGVLQDIINQEKHEKKPHRVIAKKLGTQRKEDVSEILNNTHRCSIERMMRMINHAGLRVQLVI